MSTEIVRINSDRESATEFRRLALDLALTALLLGVLLYGSLYLIPEISGKQRPIGSILLAVLLPAGVLVLLSLIERLLRPAGPRKSFKSWLLHVQIDLFYRFVAGFAGAFALIGSSSLAHHAGFKLGLIDLTFVESKGLLVALGAVWLAAITGDFFFYWFHRALHKIPLLWAHHKLHHMDRELEAVTLARQNWIEVFISALLITMPVAIFFKTDDIDPWALGALGGIVTTAFTTIVSMGHANVRLQAGWASRFWCTPQIHRIHHSRLPQHQDKNFAFILPLWDVLFGTYYQPARDEFPPTGVDGETEIQSFWEAEIFTPREWWRMFRVWRDSRTSIPT